MVPSDNPPLFGSSARQSKSSSSSEDEDAGEIHEDFLPEFPAQKSRGL